MWVNMKPYTKQLHNSRATPYTLGITDKKGLIDQQRNEIRVRPGYQIVIKVVPQLLASTEYFDELKRDQRNCKLSYETEGFIFLKEYSRIGCEFECAAQTAMSICQCLPWYYPNDFIGFHMCDMFGGHCFDKIISDDTYYQKCKFNCSKNCHETEFQVYSTEITLDMNNVCNPTSFHYQHFKHNFGKHFAFHSYKILVDGGDVPDLQTSYTNGSLCKDYVQNFVAYVSIDSPTTLVLLTNQDRRIFFYDQLGTFGGTMGLFIGMSVVSMFEVGFLVFNILQQFRKLWSIDPQADNRSQKDKETSQIIKMEQSLHVSWVLYITDKRTDVWSPDFPIWKINFGLWAVAWVGLLEKGSGPIMSNF